MGGVDQVQPWPSAAFRNGQASSWPLERGRLGGFSCAGAGQAGETHAQRSQMLGLCGGLESMSGFFTRVGCNGAEWTHDQAADSPRPCPRRVAKRPELDKADGGAIDSVTVEARAKRHQKWHIGSPPMKPSARRES